MAKYTPVRLAFRVANPESGPSGKAPVIFAHGFNVCKDYYSDLPQIVANATKRKVYAIDARNHGESEWSDVFNFDCNVDDLLHFMDTIGAPKAILVGNSMGGITVMKTALRAPERVEKLIVEDMNVQKPPPESFAVTDHLYALAKDGLQYLQKETDEEKAKQIVLDRVIKPFSEDMKNYIKPGLFEKHITLHVKRTEDGHFTYKANLASLEKATKNPSQLLSDYTGVYQGPAYFIYGKQSPFQVESDEPNIRKLFPNAEMFGMENASHALYLEYPQEYTEAVLDFIGKE